jgi:hypothetical protein
MTYPDRPVLPQRVKVPEKESAQLFMAASEVYVEALQSPIPTACADA